MVSSDSLESNFFECVTCLVAEMLLIKKTNWINGHLLNSFKVKSLRWHLTSKYGLKTTKIMRWAFIYWPSTTSVTSTHFSKVSRFCSLEMRTEKWLLHRKVHSELNLAILSNELDKANKTVVKQQKLNSSSVLQRTLSSLTEALADEQCLHFHKITRD